MSEQEARRAWRELIGKLQERQVLRLGEIGDGAGNVEVAGRAGWAWIRFQEEQNRLSMVRCLKTAYLEHGTPVLVGKEHPEDDYEQVLGIAWGNYSLDISNYLYTMYRVTRHGETHHGTNGSDPAYIDYSNLTFGRVYPTSPESLIVLVDGFVYGDGNTTTMFDGGAIDLSGDVPGAGHLDVLIYFDPEVNVLSYEVGDAEPLTASPDIPVLSSINAIPLATVRLYAGQTEIGLGDLWQRKLMLQRVGDQALTALRIALVHEGDVVTHDGEIVWGT